MYQTIENNVPIIDILPGEEWLLACFSTKMGGVSKPPYLLNLSFTVGDEDENVVKNYRLVSEAIGVYIEQMVYAHQTHTTNVLTVNKEHGGMGIIKERSFHDIDALVTNTPGVCLVTGHADCTPVFLCDPDAMVIGLAHAGWRGTVGNYLLDLVSANAVNLTEAGVQQKNITLPEYCTCCDCDVFHSHRATKGNRGGNSAFLMIRD